MFNRFMDGLSLNFCTLATDPLTMKSAIALLYECFESHLCSFDTESEAQADFIKRVVDTYFVQLREHGFLITNGQDELRSDLESDVLNMLRKKTYGFYNVDFYRKARAGKSSKVS